MSKIIPTIGRVVLYCLSAQDAGEINRRRTTGNHIAQRLSQGTWPAGAQAHIGNAVTAGEVFPGLVVRVHDEDTIAIKVELDGTDSFWAARVHCSDGPKMGMFHWMPYQKEQAAKQATSAAIPVTSEGVVVEQAVVGPIVSQDPEPVVDPAVETAPPADEVELSDDTPVDGGGEAASSES